MSFTISKLKNEKTTIFNHETFSNFPIDFLDLENGIRVQLKELVDLSAQAGKKILEIYNQNFEVKLKDDKSPLTLADTTSNTHICSFLKDRFKHIPIISEELEEVFFQDRKNQIYLWFVDPLDGTKEFIKRTGEFTVNIGLVENNTPILGIVHVPVQNLTYFSAKGKGAFKLDHNTNQIIPLHVNTFNLSSPNLNLVVSVSHPSKKTDHFVSQFESPHLVSAGSSLKLLKVAEGSADVYPRFGPTCEWDTCAAHAILCEAGGKCLNAETKESLVYNKENLLNPFFICYGNCIQKSS